MLIASDSVLLVWKTAVDDAILRLKDGFSGTTNTAGTEPGSIIFGTVKNVALELLRYKALVNQGDDLTPYFNNPITDLILLERLQAAQLV